MTTGPTTVTTVGVGEAGGTPDAARLGVAVRSTAGSVADALGGCDSAMSRLGATARRFVDPAAVSSRGLSVWPQHGRDAEVTGFEARHQVEIVCADLTQAGELVAALAAEVGDDLVIESVAPFVRDPAAMLVTARERAFADARAKAEHLAGLAGQSVTGAVSVSEGSGREQPVGVRAAMAAAASFEPGTSTLTASVTVVWQTEQR